MRHEQALLCLMEGVSEPALGALSSEHVQIVPQSLGVLTVERVDALVAAFPATQFRLHANVRVLAAHRVADLAGLQIHAEWFRQAAAISRRMHAPAYSAHAGLRSQASLGGLFDHARRAADWFGCPVGIEGHYPAPGDPWLVSNWAEYRALFESGVPYALDLSHLHILATQSGQRESSLVQDMLACERCIEVHVSTNDGRGDWHQVCDSAPWWMTLLDHVHHNAVVFSEGNHRMKRNSISSVPTFFIGARAVEPRNSNPGRWVAA